MNDNDRFERQREQDRLERQRLQYRREEQQRLFYCPKDQTPVSTPGLCQKCKAEEEAAAKRDTSSVFAEVGEESFGTHGVLAQEGRQATARNARRAFENGFGRPGESAAFQSYGTASEVRGEFGLSGREFEAAHIVPQAALKVLRDAGIECSPGRAATILLPQKVHAALDLGLECDGVLVGGWIDEWRRAVTQKEEITVRRLHQMIDQAIEALPTPETAPEGFPGVTREIKAAMSWRLHQELYQDYELSPDQIIVYSR